ncbi:Os10g0205802, partial [Oryza sativa Japonica Group]
RGESEDSLSAEALCTLHSHLQKREWHTSVRTECVVWADYDPYNGGTTGGAAECRWKVGPQGRDGMVIPAERHIHGGVDCVQQRRQAS